MKAKTVLIVLGVAAVAGGGYYVYSRRKSSTQPGAAPASLVADTRPVTPSSLVQSFLNSNNITKFSDAIRNLISKQNGVIYKEQFDSLVSDRDKEQVLFEANKAKVLIANPAFFIPPVYVAPAIVAKPYVAPVWDGVIKQPTVAPVAKTTTSSGGYMVRVAPSVHIQGLGWVELLR